MNFIETPIGDGLTLREEKVQNYWYASIHSRHRRLITRLSVYPCAAINEVLGSSVFLTPRNIEAINQVLQVRRRN